MRLTPANARRVERVSATLTDTCIDPPGRIRLPSSTQRLPAPLVSAQEALAKAERVATALTRQHPSGRAALQLLGAAKARVQTLEAINYAIERHDPTALRIGLGTGLLIEHQLTTLLRTSDRRACR